MAKGKGPKLSKGFRKYIRGEKARIRQTVSDERLQDEAIMKLRPLPGNRHH
jgi:hypothetical protein